MSEAAPHSAPAEVLVNHRQRGNAYASSDLEAYLSSYWDDAHVVIDGASYDIAALRSAMVSFFESGGGPVLIDLPEPTYINIGPSGDAVVTSFTWRERLRTREGTEQDLEYSESDVWIRRNGQWRLVLAHLNCVQPDND
jgi:ketosteroid isomerase-like protein